MNFDPILLNNGRLRYNEPGIIVDSHCVPAGGQEQEHQLRDDVARPYLRSREEAVREATRHHSKGVMLRRARQAVQLARAASPEPVIVDLGCGFGWHWIDLAREHQDVRFLLVDFSMVNLHVVRNLMPFQSTPNVLCLQASIVDLPLKDAVASYVWTVQVLQHLHAQPRMAALAQVRRILMRGGGFYIAWLRTVPLIRTLRRLVGRSYHTSGMTPYGLYLDRFTPGVAAEIRSILPEGVVSFSESLFHPDARFRAGSLGAADLGLSATPLARLLARQAEVSGKL